MDKNITKAESLFKKDFNCCQSILAAFGPDYGLSEELCLKLATGFGAGMSYQGKTCGAVSGAYMVLSLINGNKIPNDEIRKELTYSHIKKFNEQFVKKHSSVNCNDLLGADISTLEGLESISEKNLFNKLCPKLVKYSAEIIIEITKTKKK